MHTQYIYIGSHFHLVLPHAVVTLALDLSLLTAAAAGVLDYRLLDFPEHTLACRPTGLGMMHALSGDAGSVWAADESVQMRKYGKE